MPLSEAAAATIAAGTAAAGQIGSGFLGLIGQKNVKNVQWRTPVN